MNARAHASSVVPLGVQSNSASRAGPAVMTCSPMDSACASYWFTPLSEMLSTPAPTAKNPARRTSGSSGSALTTSSPYRSWTTLSNCSAVRRSS